MTEASGEEGEEDAESGQSAYALHVGPEFQVPQRVLQIGGKYDPLPRREKTRSWLALGLVGLLALIASALVGLTAAKALAIDDTKDLIDGILSPLIALAGAALGFYFGGHHGSG
jgi:hypothetical protein